MQRIEDRGWRIEDRAARLSLSSILYLLFSILSLLPGCTYNSSGPSPEIQSPEQRQAAAVNDPIKNNYEDNTRRYDISGGGFNNLDKGALNRDLKNALDP
jgi:hypothetical protein